MGGLYFLRLLPCCSRTALDAPCVTSLPLAPRLARSFYPSGASAPGASYPPSGALLKAVLLGGASNMVGNTEASLPLEPAPSFRQGYGLVNLTRSLPLAGNAGGWRMQVHHLGGGRGRRRGGLHVGGEAG